MQTFLVSSFCLDRKDKPANFIITSDNSVGTSTGISESDISVTHSKIINSN